MLTVLVTGPTVTHNSLWGRSVECVNPELHVCIADFSKSNLLGGKVQWRRNEKDSGERRQSTRCELSMTLLLCSMLLGVPCTSRTPTAAVLFVHLSVCFFANLRGSSQSFRPWHIRQQYFSKYIHQWNKHPLRTLMSRLQIWRHCNLWRHSALNRTNFHRQRKMFESFIIMDSGHYRYQISKQIIVTGGKVVAVCRVVLV